MCYLISKSYRLEQWKDAPRTISSSHYWRSLLSLTLLILLSSLGRADGVMDFGAPVFTTVPAYCKKIVRFNTRSGFDGFASLHWEVNNYGTVPLPDGTSDKYGHKALVGVFQSDLTALAGKPKGTVAFKAPYFIKFGDTTSWGPGVDAAYENDLASGDMNGDGFADLVLLNTASHWVAIYYNDGDGNFPAKPSIAREVTYTRWDSTWLPNSWGVREHPFQLAIGDFDGDGKNDFAVSYIYKSDFVILGFFQKSGYEPDYMWGRELPRDTFDQCLRYDWESPYYTIAVYLPPPKGEVVPLQAQGSIFQMVTAREPGQPNDLLFFRPAAELIYKLDYLKKSEVNIRDLLPPMPWDVTARIMYGPFTVATVDGIGLDVVTGSGSTVIFDNGVGPISTSVALTLNTPGAVLAADFNLDGITDLARLHGDYPHTMTVGTELMVTYGDRVFATNPFFSGGRKLITGLSIPPRYWENHAIMIAGNFTGDFDLMSKNPFQSIMVLGEGFVVVYPNVGNEIEQINKPMLEQLISGPEASDGDTIKITGKYWLGTTSEVTDLILTADVGGKVTTIPRANLMIRPGTPETLEFALPPGLAPGDYTVTVKNVRWTSNELKLKVIATPKLIVLLTGPEAKINDAVLISGDFLLGTPSEITELVLTPAMGMATSIARASLNITAGMPDTLEFTVPSGLALGEYTVTVKNMKSTSNGLKLKIVP